MDCNHPTMCVCMVVPFIMDVRLVDAPAGVTQEECHTGFIHLPFAVVALIFLSRMFQPFLSLVHREVEFCVPTNSSFLLGSFFCEDKSQFDNSSPVLFYVY